MDANGRTLIEEPIASDAGELAQAMISAGLHTEDLAFPGRVFFRFLAGGEIVGFGGYEPCGPDALVRSVVVLPPFRGRGFARELVGLIERHAQEGGALQLFLLTNTARALFERLGFTEVSRKDAPPAILATREASSLCRPTTTLMRKALPGREATRRPSAGR
jgi:arsenate reductase